MNPKICVWIINNNYEYIFEIKLLFINFLTMTVQQLYDHVTLGPNQPPFYHKLTARIHSITWQSPNAKKLLAIFYGWAKYNETTCHLRAGVDISFFFLQTIPRKLSPCLALFIKIYSLKLIFNHMFYQIHNFY